MSSYRTNTASREQILQHFKECEFEPQLESYVDLEEYIEKILKNAERFECWADNSLAGLVALYANNTDTRECFVTMVSVGAQYGGKGIAGALIERAIIYSRENKFERMGLEVFLTNQRAIKIYDKFGFQAVHTGENKIKMELMLGENG